MTDCHHFFESLESKCKQVISLLEVNDVGTAVNIVKEGFLSFDLTSQTEVCGYENRSLHTILDAIYRIIAKFEEDLENRAYTWDLIQTEKESKISNGQKKMIQDILHSLFVVHTLKSNFCSTFRNNFDFDNEDIADIYLDEAIAAKKAGYTRNATKAHYKRMMEDQTLLYVDAVRLLGLNNNRYLLEDGVSETVSAERYVDSESLVEEICDKGLFEITPSIIPGTSLIANRASIDACDHGQKVQKLLSKSGYTLSSTSRILHETIRLSNSNCSSSGRLLFDSKRVYSANSFFNQRHSIWQQYFHLQKIIENDALLLFALVFLFGVSIEYNDLANAIGTESLNILFDAKILRIHPFRDSLVIGEVQIYPLDISTFQFDGIESNDTYGVALYMTDWPMESLRLNRDAIMPIGYDSLELVALTSGLDFFSKGCTSKKILDLCCGCGVQGIHAALSSCYKNKTRISETRLELLSMDINRRACHFVTANSCLNFSFDKDTEGKRLETNVIIHSMQGDLYKPLKCNQNDAAATIGTFNYIFTNPPFVAVPFTKCIGTMSPAFYSAGGGMDGMKILQKILEKCFEFLEEDKYQNSSLYMVTELPNVEECPNLLLSMLPANITSQVRVAYIKDDVETVEAYVEEREIEAGLHIEKRDWKPSLEIRNRALVLVSISHNEGESLKELHCYQSSVEQSNEAFDYTDADEEDTFLTRDGVLFSRKKLL